MIYAEKMASGSSGSDAKTFGQLDSSFWTRSALLVFLVLSSSWKSAGGTAASSWRRTFLRSTSWLRATASSLRNKTSVSMNHFRSLSFGRAFFMSANVNTVVFFSGSQKFLEGLSPSCSLMNQSATVFPISWMLFSDFSKALTRPVALSSLDETFWTLLKVEWILALASQILGYVLYILLVPVKTSVAEFLVQFVITTRVAKILERLCK